jgi:hypothetical protein
LTGGNNAHPVIVPSNAAARSSTSGRFIDGFPFLSSRQVYGKLYWLELRANTGHSATRVDKPQIYQRIRLRAVKTSAHQFRTGAFIFEPSIEIDS